MLEDPIVKDQFLIGSDTVFDFGHRIFSPSDITCYVYDPSTGSETMLTSGTDFTVGLKPETTDYSNGARVTLLTEQPEAGKLTVVRTVLPQQGVALPNFGKIPSESLEAQMDRTVAAVQQLHDTVQLAYKISYGQSGTVTPEQAIKDMISSGGGGGGGGSSYEFSNEFTVTSGGSVSINKIDKSKITGLADALNGKQDKLVSGGSYNINVNSAAVAGGFAYNGPFAVITDSEEGTAGCSSGYVYAGGSHILVSGFGSDETAFNEGDTLYLTLSSGGGSISSGLVTSPTGLSSDTVLVRLAHNAGGVAKQIQFGDITTVPWGLGGSGGGAGIESRSLGSHTESATGLLNAVVDMNNSSPGQALILTISGNVTSAIVVPQSGGTGLTSSYARVISSGQTWSATSEINASYIKMNFIKF